MKKSLEQQIKEKKNRETLERQSDKNYEDVIKNNLGEYNKSLELIVKKKQDQKIYYKNVLDSQIQNKKKLNLQCKMNESEKVMNKEILNQILVKNK